MSQLAQLHCPNCGHHVADVTRAPTPDQSRELAEGEARISAVLARVHAKMFGVEHLEDDELGTVSAEEIYAAYLRWAEGAGRVPIGPKALGTALRAIGLKPYRTKHQRGYMGVRLRD